MEKHMSSIGFCPVGLLFSSQWCACEWKRLGSPTICLSLGSRWQWHIKPVSKWMSSTKCPFQSPKNKMGPQTYSQNDKRDGSPVQNHLCMICDKAILQKFKSSVIHIIIDVTIWRIFAHSTVNSLQIFTQSDVWHLSYFLTLSLPQLHHLPLWISAYWITTLANFSSEKKPSVLLKISFQCWNT